MSNPYPLDGTVVLEISHPLTEYAGLVLAGLGATVFLVEPPGGGHTRDRAPFAEGASPDRKSIPFLARNSNKLSVVVDVSDSADRNLLEKLTANADVIILPPEGTLAKAVGECKADTPRITVTDPDGLGVSSIVGFAASGGLASCGWPHQPPCNAPGWLPLDGAGIYAATMAMVAKRQHRQGTRADYVIRYRDAANASITPWTRPLHSYGMVAGGQGADTARLGAGPLPVYPCKDGAVKVAAVTPRQWSAWLQLLGNPEALAGPEWEDAQFRQENFDAIAAVASELVADRTAEELFLGGQRLGLTITPLLDIPGVLADPHVQSRGFFQTVEDPELGEIQMPSPPYRLGDEQTRHPVIPAPGLNEHGEEARQLAQQPQQARTTAEAGGRLPLEGVRVLDCGVGAVVPEAASMMALLGAQVIKIESRQNLDFLRRTGLGGAGDHNNSPTFNQLNLGVQSFAVDMGTPAGIGVVRRLVAECDVMMENMRGGVMKKWQLDYDTVRSLRPDIVYFSSQGLGTGPYDGFQTYGPNLQTFSGVTAIWAHPDDPYPVGGLINHPDHAAGKQAVAAIIGALERRDRTGDGCFLDWTQFETASYMIGDKFLQEQLQPGTAIAVGNRSPDYAPHGCYPCAGEDTWSVFAVEDDKQWQSFAEMVGEEWAQRPDLATADGRLANVDELDSLVGEWTRKQTPDEVYTALRAAGVPTSKLVTGDMLAEDAEAHESGFFGCVTHPTAGQRWYAGLPVEGPMGRFPTRRAPLLGEHDEHVLLGVLGLTQSEVTALADAGVIGH